MSSKKYEDDPGEESHPMSEKDEGRSRSVYQNNESSRKRARQLKCWRIMAIAFIAISVILVVALIVVVVAGKGKMAKMDTTSREGETGAVKSNDHNEKKCDSSRKVSNEKLVRGEKLFSGLTPQETQEVIKYLMNRKELQLTNASKAELGDNYIYSIESELPTKSDMLRWLDGTNRSPPARKAKVLLFMGKKRAVEKYTVSPIPKPRQMKKVQESLTWQARPISPVENKAIGSYMFKQFEETIPGIYFASFARDCVKVSMCPLHYNAAPRAVIGSTDRHVVAWFFVSSNKIVDYYMYALPFYIILKTPANSLEYEIVSVFYNGGKYDSLVDLQNKYLKDKDKIGYKLPDLGKQKSEYGSPERAKQGNRIDETRRPPISYHPDGPRVAVTGSAVEWLGWSFNIHPRTLAGIQLFNVVYNNERIAYELSMQDILVLYSGGPPDDYFKSYFDNGWSTGAYTTPLIRGVDCPMDAVYTSTNIYNLARDEGRSRNDTVCIFEHRNSVPMRRHYSASFADGKYRFAFSMPDTVLIVRQIVTLWNYDYIFDYEFHQNGVIELKVSSTGYVAVTNNLDGSNPNHGYVINDYWKTTANLHQHIFNFKVDLDVGGRKNNFKTVNMKSNNFAQNDFSGGKAWPQIVMEETVINKEEDAAIRYSFDKPKLYVVYNDKQKGYRIQSNNFHHTTLPDNAPLLKGGASWAKYQLAVTKFDESEKTTASEFVQGDPFNPAVNFDDFIQNNDNLKDEDLVVWVTVGLHHVPTYEDLPVTTTPGKTLSVALVPFNYYKRDPSIASHDATVLWHELVGKKDDYLYKNATCSPLNHKPSVQ